MADFNLVDPKGWEYDLQSVRAPSHVYLVGIANSFPTRSTPPTWATSSCTVFLGAAACRTHSPSCETDQARPASRFDRSWGVFFESFEEFLTFSWPCIVVTDRWTGKAHIVTRMTSIGAFVKMIKTRYVHCFPSHCSR